MSDLFDPFKGAPDQRRYGEYYSHSGADLVVFNIFELLGIQHTASYLDIGAHHPTIISNTAMFYKKGLRGVNVEANPHLIENFMRERPKDLNLNIGVSVKSGKEKFYFIDNWSGRNTFSARAARDFIRDWPQFSISNVRELPVLTLNDLIVSHCGGKYPDFLTIDIEQLDFDVLKSADFLKSHPRIICAETINYDGTQNYEAFRVMLDRKGFTTYCRLIADTIFIWHEDASQLGLDSVPPLLTNR